MSSRSKSSLIYLREHTQKQVIDLFSEAKLMSQGSFSPLKSGQTAALIFFEASTRTRMSFETACARLGVHPLVFSGKSGTSLEKGETYADTVLNIAAMNPSVLIIRSGDDFDMQQAQGQVKMPILNAGWGRVGHPTQALLDAFTIWDRQGDLKKEKVLIIGDVRHSRVAASHFELSEILGYEVALCGPKEFLPDLLADLSPVKPGRKVFNNLEEGLQWATVAMALRVQNERHSENHSQTNYSSLFGLNRDKLKNLSKEALIMHPGPINHGVEMDLDAIQDPRAVILQQVTNGIYIRQALVHRACREGAL